MGKPITTGLFGLFLAFLVLIWNSFLISINIYFNSFKKYVSLQKAKDINSSKELAFEKYFFGKAFNDLKNIVKESIKEYHTEDFSTMVSVIYISSFIFIHLTVILLIAIFLYMVRFPMYILDRSYILIRKFSATCPSCYAQETIPFYICDSCKVVHKKLYPNQYGIFFHKCKCGNKLPSIFFLNRKKIEAKCPNCNIILSGNFIQTKKVFIPIVGGPSVGKTNFMFSVVKNLIEKDEYRRGFEANFSDKNTKSKYDKIIKDIKDGFLPKKTADYLPKAFNIILTKAKKTTWTFYLYDAAGESYMYTDNINIQEYNKYSSGIIFIIDPFSLEKVKNKYKYKLKKIAVSREPVDDILSRLISSLENTSNLKKTEKYKKPFAIVLNKVDELENEIINKNPEKGKEQLEEWGEYKLLQKIEVRFENVKFFRVSALNSLKNNHNDVMEPIMWIANNEGFTMAK